MLAIVLAACISQSGGVSQPPETRQSFEDSARLRFADALMREAFLAVSPTDLVPSEIAAALFMAQRSASLSPSDSARWRMVLSVADLGGELLPGAREASEEAVVRLAKLCPGDQVIRLRRLVNAIERQETAEDRVSSYRAFLTLDAIKAIGQPVASRLSFDLALLESRMGDIDAFADDLARSLLMSPSYPAAAETAAGFIAERIDDPVSECELLVNAALANPIEERSWTRLGALLMQEGAYNSAIRVLGLAESCARTDRAADKSIDVVVGDIALALWGAGRIDDASARLTKRLNENKDAFATAVQNFNPGFSRADAESIPGPVSPILATLAAGVANARNAPELKPAINAMIASVLDQVKVNEQLAKRQAGAGAPAAALDPAVAASHAAELLEVAMSAALLGADGATLAAVVGEVELRQPLSQPAKDRFAAWTKLRSGDSAGALIDFEKFAGHSSALRFGRAEAIAATGNQQEAARSFMAIASESRGTMIGLLANERLRAIVGQGIPATTSVGKLDGLVASIPPTMERYLSQTAPAVEFSVVPRARTLKPFDPILYTLTIKNLTSLTLAIAPEGPIKEFVLLQPLLIVAGREGPDRLVPQVIPLDRVIDLPPGESVSLDWDFGWTTVGLRAAMAAIEGSSLSFRGASNFTAGMGFFHVGAFGSEPVVADLEIEGVRVTPEWIDASLAAARAPSRDEDLVTMALLVNALKTGVIPSDRTEAVALALGEGFPRLPADAQAWLVLMMPRSTAGTDQLLANIDGASPPDVMAAYLLNLCVSQEDPKLAMAKQSGDRMVQIAVEMVGARFQREAARADERMRGERQESQSGARDTAPDAGTGK